MVVFDPEVYPMDMAWLTGKASAEHLRHTRPSYYRRLISEAPAAPESEAPEGDLDPKDAHPIDRDGSV
jgi:hypothetical protein